MEHETNGFLIYTPDKVAGKTLWRVHSFHMLGRGSAYHVKAHPYYLKAANAFLQELRRRDPRARYEFMKAHTHCRGTGEQWFNRFSGGDLEAVKVELPENPGFTLMMYSPTHHLATGHPRNEYRIVVVPSQPAHVENTEHLNVIYRETVRRKGIRLPQIESVIKRRED
ncbi:MAG: hypothetical protein AB1626_03560 [Candidatus Micrarchaeota archaeon]